VATEPDQAKLPNQFNIFWPSGKSILIVRNIVKPRNEKYSSSVIPKYLLYPRRLILSTRGVSRSLRTLGWDAVDVEVPIANGMEAYGKGVWSWRPEVGVNGGNSTWLTGESSL
jgi:hypothetical protein